MPRYARNGDVSLAYDVVGEGDRDILITFGWIGSFQSAWDVPAHARWMVSTRASARWPATASVSQTVKDLVAGSGLDFEDRGEHELKGVPGSWRLYSVGAG